MLPIDEVIDHAWFKQEGRVPKELTTQGWFLTFNLGFLEKCGDVSSDMEDWDRKLY